jgi:hypothetical protein
MFYICVVLQILFIRISKINYDQRLKKVFLNKGKILRLSIRIGRSKVGHINKYVLPNTKNAVYGLRFLDQFLEVVPKVSLLGFRDQHPKVKIRIPDFNFSRHSKK